MVSGQHAEEDDDPLARQAEARDQRRVGRLGTKRIEIDAIGQHRHPRGVDALRGQQRDTVGRAGHKAVGPVHQPALDMARDGRQRAIVCKRSVVDQLGGQAALQVGDQRQSMSDPQRGADRDPLVEMPMDQVWTHPADHPMRGEQDPEVQHRTRETRAERPRSHAGQRAGSLDLDIRHVASGRVRHDMGSDAKRRQPLYLFVDPYVAPTVTEERRGRDHQDPQWLVRGGLASLVVDASRHAPETAPGFAAPPRSSARRSNPGASP